MQCTIATVVLLLVFACLYKHTYKSSATPPFFGDTVFEVAEREYVGNGNHIFGILL